MNTTLLKEQATTTTNPALQNLLKQYTFRTINKGSSHIIPVPLCWGNEQDETVVQELIQAYSTSIMSSSTTSKKKNNKVNTTTSPQHDDAGSTTSSSSLRLPNLILIGDVAYQHYPGAPSHFDELISTVRKFSSVDTIIIFGLRIRMPASVDLLELFLQYYEEIVQPPISATELDPIDFPAAQKHNMTIHFLKLKNQLLSSQN